MEELRKNEKTTDLPSFLFISYILLDVCILGRVVKK